jgi:hypothetical protein
MQGGG